jgi:hypothetical protein
VIVKCSAWTERDLELHFGDLAGDVEPVHFTEAVDLPNLMKELGVFPSTSEARRAGRTGPIPEGWTEMKASKKRMLWVWNPTE